MELNPNHAVTQELHENWHKFVAVLLHKFKLGKVLISVDDLVQLERDFPEGLPTVVAQERGDQIELRLVDAKEAYRLAASEGGLPV
jgi:hypothetical protein